MSLTALGNQLLLPRTFPSWVTPMEHNKVFWTSSKEARILFFKLIFSSIALGCALATKFRGGRWLRLGGGVRFLRRGGGFLRTLWRPLSSSTPFRQPSLCLPEALFPRESRHRESGIWLKVLFLQKCEPFWLWLSALSARNSLINLVRRRLLN